MSEPTTEILARALKEAPGPFPKRQEMIQKAREGWYHDFLSPLDMPCMQLIQDLRMQGQDALAQDAMDGRFDASKEEAHAWFASEEGQSIFRELIEGE